MVTHEVMKGIGCTIYIYTVLLFLLSFLPSVVQASEPVVLINRRFQASGEVLFLSDALCLQLRLILSAERWQESRIALSEDLASWRPGLGDQRSSVIV